MLIFYFHKKSLLLMRVLFLTDWRFSRVCCERCLFVADAVVLSEKRETLSAHLMSHFSISVLLPGCWSMFSCIRPGEAGNVPEDHRLMHSWILLSSSCCLLSIENSSLICLANKLVIQSLLDMFMYTPWVM